MLKIPLLEGFEKEDTKQLQNDKDFRQLIRTMLLNYGKNQQLNNIGKQSSEHTLLRLYYTERRKQNGTYQYRNIVRDVEPYSFRRKYNKKQHRSYYYFYQYCLMHNKIHSFRLDRLKNAELISTKFSPKWDIEINNDYITNLKKSIIWGE